MTIRKVLEEVANGEIDIEQALKDIQSTQRMVYSSKITAEQLEILKEQLEAYVDDPFFAELDSYEEITSSQLKNLIEKHISEDFLDKVKELGYEIDRKMAAKYAIHDVNPAYIAEMDELDLEGTDAKTLVKAKIHDVIPQDIVSFQDAGVIGSLKQFIKMKIHGITPELALRLETLGYNELGANDLVKLAIHDVTPDYIEAIKRLGLNPRLNEFKKMAIHGVSVSYVKELREMGFGEIGISDLIKSRIHGLEGELIGYYRTLFEDISLKEMTKLSIHGINQEYITEIKEAGLENLSPKELIKLSNHGVRGVWIGEFQKMGFTEMTPREYIKAKSHGVSPDYVEEIKEAGMDDMSLSEVMQFRIHGVYPSFIRKVHEIGYTPTAQQFVQLQIHGVTLAEIAHGRVENLELQQIIRKSIHH